MEDARGAVATIVIGYCLILEGSAGMLGFIPDMLRNADCYGNNFSFWVWLDRLLGVKLPNALFLSFAGAGLFGPSPCLFKRGDHDGAI